MRESSREPSASATPDEPDDGVDLADLVARARDAADQARSVSSDPLLHASSEALAVAHSLAVLSASTQSPAGQWPSDALHQALYSIRAVQVAIRFALVKQRQ
jgi:hypothetical protein